MPEPAARNTLEETGIPAEVLKERGELAYSDCRALLSDGDGCDHHFDALAGLVVARGAVLFPDLASHHGTPHARSPAPSAPGDPLGIYLAEIRRFGATTRAEEFRMARALDLAQRVFRSELQRSPDLPAKAASLRETLGHRDPLVARVLDELVPPGELCHDGRENGHRTLDRARSRLGQIARVRSALISHTLYLVPRMARRYRSRTVAYLDLIQEGNAALLRAADKYDWHRGVRFSSYAQWWIQQAILKFIYCHSRVVRLPVYLHQQLKKIRSANRDALAEHGRELSAEEISSCLKEPVGRIRQALRACPSAVSLDQLLGEEGEFCLAETLGDRSEDAPPELTDGPGLSARLAELLATLSAKERRILEMRYGLGGSSPMTLQEVSRRFDVSRERIRQIQVQALGKLQRPARKKLLAAYL